MKLHRGTLLALSFLLLSSCGKQAPPANGPDNSSQTGAAPGGTAGSRRLKIGYVLHGLNDFTQVIKRGAEDAGKALDADVEVVGPAGFTANEAQGMFEGMVQKKKDGLVVIPMPGEVWVKPIKQAVDAGLPVVTANITSAESAASSWFGQDEYQSGVVLAAELRKILNQEGKKSGKVLVGICAPGVPVLEERYKGLKKGLEGSGFTPTEARDVNTENTANYSAWENLATANPDMAAAVGLCSMDIPNLAKVKSRSKGKWIVGGYDLNTETLDALKAGTAQVSLGQHPYLQGYLPVLALVRYLRDKKPLPRGWVDVGTEIVTRANVDTVYPRETKREEETRWYANLIAQKYGDMSALEKPLPKTH